MIEEPSFDYKYDLALWKSFAARLSVNVLGIAAAVFLLSTLTYLYFFEESVKEKTAQQAKMQLHDVVMNMRLKASEKMAIGDSLSVDMFLDDISHLKPYKHSYSLLANKNNFLFVGDSIFLEQPITSVRDLCGVVNSGKSGMIELPNSSVRSLMIYEPVGLMDLYAAVVCSRTDIIMSYKTLILYGACSFIVGLFLLFLCCTVAIRHMVLPLERFVDATKSIAKGDLDTPLPEIHSEDELLVLRNSFENMQTSLKQYIEDLRTTTASKERMQSELTIAHDIQMGMIPTSFPTISSIDIYASMTPAKEVGGDLFDFILDGNELFFIIGDVAGKGVPASLYMAVTRTLFRNLAGNYQSAGNVVREINRAITSSNDSCIFVTLFVGVIDTQNDVLTFCNASHNPPVITLPTGETDFMKVEPNIPIGVIERYEFIEQQIDFKRGTSILLYTDGLTEATDESHRLYGLSELLKNVSENQSSSSKEIISCLKDSVEKHYDGAELSDDLTMMCIKKTANTNDKHSGKVLLLKNEMAELSRLQSFLLSICKEHGVVDKIARKICLAMEEAVVNVINYAYPHGTRGHIRVSADVDNNIMILTIKDRGKAFDPTKAEIVDVTKPLEERTIGGLGIHIIRQTMDDMTYQRTTDGYNILSLSKNLNNI